MFTGFSALWVDDLSIFPPYSARTISGTALQERTHTIASRNVTIHSLLVNLSLETTLEGRADISEGRADSD